MKINQTFSKLFFQKMSVLFIVIILFCFQDINNLQARPDLPPEEYRGDPLTQELIEGSSVIQEASFGIAWGDPDGPHSVYDWPYDVVQMGLVIQSYQNYSSGIDSAYFHHGIDMVAPDGTHVYNRSGGQVVNIENYGSSDYYWEVAILDPEGYVWQYHHIDKNTIPQLIHNKFAEWQANPETGGYIPPNTHIGDIILWPVISLGYRFNHIHLNILADGDVYLNGLEFHTPLVDDQVPEIQEIGLLDGDTIIEGNTASGNYGLYVRARDLFMSPVYYLPPYKTEFSINGGDWVTVWEFHDFPGGFDDHAYVNDFFVPYYTKGNYDVRDFYIDLGFTTEGQRSFPSEPGQYSIEVRVSDYAGNTTSSTFDWNVYATYENTTQTTIPDNGCSSGNGVTRTFNVPDNFLVNDVNLGININHNSRGQLKVYIQGPGDEEPTQIINTASDTYNNINVLVDDSSDNPLNNAASDTTSAPYYDRVVGPSLDGSLDSLKFGNASGDWSIFICDATAGTTGTVNRIRLDLLPPNPNSVELISFDAMSQHNEVQLTWETASEVNNAGFNIYRAEEYSGQRIKVNPELIPSQSPGSNNGATYQYSDSNINPGTQYFYWLEDIDLSLREKNIYGPIETFTYYKIYMPLFPNVN